MDLNIARISRFVKGSQAMAWQLFSTPSGRTRSVGRWQFSGRAERLCNSGRRLGARNPWTHSSWHHALYLTWPILPHYTSTAEDLAIAAVDLFDAIATGILKVDPSNLYPFSQIIEAHHDLEERRTTGAAVLRVTAADLP